YEHLISQLKTSFGPATDQLQSWGQKSEEPVAIVRSCLKTGIKRIRPDYIAGSKKRYRWFETIIEKGRRTKLDGLFDVEVGIHHRGNFFADGRNVVDALVGHHLGIFGADLDH